MPNPENMTQSQLANLEGHKFVKGQSGNPNGRPRNRVNALLRRILPKGSLKKAEALSLDEVNTIERVVLSLDQAGLQTLVDDAETPAYLKTLAKAVLTDLKGGRMQAADRLRSRQYGDLPQSVDLSVATKSLEEIEDELSRLRRQDAIASGKEIEP